MPALLRRGRPLASIKKLAQRLDVSIGTVSRALNDRPGVNLETRAMALRLAQELGYVANASGRSLRSGVTNTVGLVSRRIIPPLWAGTTSSSRWPTPCRGSWSTAATT